MLEMYQTAAYVERNPTWHEEDAPWKARQIEGILRRNTIACGTICEIGCGTGDILLTLERAFPDATLSGYEISPHAYARASRKETARTRFYLEDLAAKRDSRFDVLLAIDVIEHVEDYLGFAKQLRGLAGVKVFHIPLDLSVQSLLRGWPISKLRKDVGHIHSFFKESALATLEDCGYRIIDHCYTASRLELPNQAWTSHAMKWPRRALFALNPDLAVRILGGYSLLVLAE